MTRMCACVARALLPADSNHEQKEEIFSDYVGTAAPGCPGSEAPASGGSDPTAISSLPALRGRVARAHTNYFASSGTTFRSSLSVHRSTVSEQLTPTRT